MSLIRSLIIQHADAAQCFRPALKWRICWSFRSTWRPLAFSSRTLRRTAPWTTCVSSSTWPTIPRQSDFDRLEPIKPVLPLSPHASLSSLLTLLCAYALANQHRAHHHPSPGADVCRVLGLPVREARPRHPHGHELLRRGSERGTAAALLSLTSHTDGLERVRQRRDEPGLT